MSADANDYTKLQRRKMFLIFIAADKINGIRVLQRCTQSNFVMVFVLQKQNTSFMGSEYLILRTILQRECFLHLMKTKVKRKTHRAYKLSILLSTVGQNFPKGDIKASDITENKIKVSTADNMSGNLLYTD